MKPPRKSRAATSKSSSLFYRFIRGLLFQLDPEKSHVFTLNFLKFLYTCKLLPHQKLLAPCQVMGLDFPNPVGLAAGMDKNGDYIKPLAALGFGFIEVGTITPRPQPGNPKPRLFRIPSVEALINRLGFNNKGVEYLINQIKSAHYKGILGINIGKNFDTPIDQALNDYMYCFRKVYRYASYVTINISSPNTAELRDLQFGKHLENLLKNLKKQQKQLALQYNKYVPLVIKISPDLNEADIRQIADQLLHYKIDGVCATNTTVSRRDIEGLPLAHEKGGVSGKPLLIPATTVVKLLAKELNDKIPIIAVGGIMSREDAEKKINAGASLLQIYTGLIYKGPKLIKNIVVHCESLNQKN